MTVHTILPNQLDDPELLCQNRLTMLHYLAANTAAVRDEFSRAISTACDGGLTLACTDCQQFACLRRDKVGCGFDFVAEAVHEQAGTY
ncbi:hypothetical protein [Burkholderia ambifaria]|uniref:hypothetical protein n=1 Tax=Burkholderia ambifaria TaxID=152480 RepID=UPI001E45B449|nr:hypothetical protein [Burkholderia ambifaria]